MGDRFMLSLINGNRNIPLQSLQIALKNLSRNCEALNVNNITNINLRLCEIRTLVNRLTKWPSSIDINYFLQNQSVSLQSEVQPDNNFLKAQLISTEIILPENFNVLSSYHSIFANNNFPCQEISSAIPKRSISPFTQTIRSNGRDVIYLSSVAYFEVKIEPSHDKGLFSYFLLFVGINVKLLLLISIRYRCNFYRSCKFSVPTVRKMRRR